MVMTVCAPDAQRPLPSAGGGELLQLSDGVTFIEADDGSGSVFLWGSVAWIWSAGDRVARRLAAVQLIATKAAPQRRVAAAFKVNEDTLILWRGQYAMNGVAGLAGRRPGPKGPSKLTEAKRTEISALRVEGFTLNAIAERVSVSTDTVRRALAHGPQLVTTEETGDERELLATRPTARGSARHQATWSTSVMGSHPVICDGQSLPLGGALIVMPALAATGLLDEAARVYDVGRTASGGLRTLIFSTVFAFLLGDRHVEGPTHVDLTDTGRLLGLNRAPARNTMHRRMQALAALGRADRLIEALARRHLDGHREVEGIFSLDGDVHAYRRSGEVADDDLARIRLSMGADIDARPLDRDGDGVLLWTAPADEPVEDLRAILAKVRDLAGPLAHPTICFERGGWPPKLFAELTAARFDIVAYGKGCPHLDPVTSFHWHSFTDDSGSIHRYLLADQEAHIGYDSGRRHFRCRQIVGLEPHTGQQTHILTTRADSEPATIAHAMFNRWSDECFIDTMRALRGVDALDGSESAKPAVDDVGLDAAGRSGERERIREAVHMAAYNAESALARILVPRHAPTCDAARMLLREAFRTSADVQIIGDELHVHVNPISSPRDARAMAALCAELTTTKTVYPGSNLTLVYSTEQGAAAG